MPLEEAVFLVMSNSLLVAAALAQLSGENVTRCLVHEKVGYLKGIFLLYLVLIVWVLFFCC